MSYPFVSVARMMHLMPDAYSDAARLVAECGTATPPRSVAVIQVAGLQRRIAVDTSTFDRAVAPTFLRDVGIPP